MLEKLFPRQSKKLERVFKDHLVVHKPYMLKQEMNIHEYYPGLMRETHVYRKLGTDEIVTQGIYAVMRDKKGNEVMLMGKKPTKKQAERLEHSIGQIKASENPEEFFEKLTQQLYPLDKIFLAHKGQIQKNGFKIIPKTPWQGGESVEKRYLEKENKVYKIFPSGIPRIEMEISRTGIDAKPRFDEIQIAQIELLEQYVGAMKFVEDAPGRKQIKDIMKKIKDNDKAVHEIIEYMVRKNRVKERILTKLLEFADDYAK